MTGATGIIKTPNGCEIGTARQNGAIGSIRGTKVKECVEPDMEVKA